MNTDKAKAILEIIKADTDRWEQSIWTNIGFVDGLGYYADKSAYKEKTEKNQVINCGTVGCFAGHTAFHYAPVGTKFFGDYVVLPISPKKGYEERYDYETYAMQILELTKDEAYYLFAPDRSIEDFETYVNSSPEGRHSLLIDYYGDGSMLLCSSEMYDCPYPH